MDPLLGGFPTNNPPGNNAIAFDRTTRQVLNIVFGAKNATKGLFFPKGLNGIITSCESILRRGQTAAKANCPRSLLAASCRAFDSGAFRRDENGVGDRSKALIQPSQHSGRLIQLCDPNEEAKKLTAASRVGIFTREDRRSLHYRKILDFPSAHASPWARLAGNPMAKCRRRPELARRGSWFAGSGSSREGCVTRVSGGWEGTLQTS